MKLNSKGQVTLPAPIRERHGLHEGDEVEVVDDGGTSRIIRAPGPRRGVSGWCGGCAAGPLLP